MKYKHTFWLLALVFLAVVEVTAQEKELVSEVPAGIVSILAANPKGCPVAISGPFRVFSSSNGGIDLGYSMKNNAATSVRSIRVIAWNWMISHGTVATYNITDANIPFGAGVERYSIGDEYFEKMTPYEFNPRARDFASGNANRIWVIMIERVELIDGTVFDFSAESRRLDAILESRPTGKKDLVTWEKELRALIAGASER